MIAAVINGIVWRIQIVPPTFPALFTGTSFTLGCCDGNAKTIYIADGLSESKFYKVLGHEMTHAAMFSYSVVLTEDGCKGSAGGLASQEWKPGAQPRDGS